MRILTIFLFSLATSLLIANSAQALYMNFLNNAPLNYFTKQDFDLSNHTVFEALEKAKDGHKISWQNPQSGAFGYALPSNSHDNCRNLQIFNSAQGVKSITNYKFCKIQGKWKVIS